MQRSLTLIKFAMVLTVAIAVTLTYFLGSRVEPLFPPDHPIVVGYFIAMLLALAGVVFVFRRKRDQAGVGRQFLSYTLVCWAAGEGVVLFGAMMGVFSGNKTFLYAGAVAFLIILFLVPQTARKDA
ncbi:MAG: hypothetical protein SH809_07940 [Rhodothermales bacterium]|nr:hypothetical protein [Rhodothermales bacterium]